MSNWFRVNLANNACLPAAAALAIQRGPEVPLGDFSGKLWALAEEMAASG